MNLDNKFSQSDKDKVVEFLNFVAKQATFTCKTGEMIEYVKLLNFMQSTVLKKIDANILEILSVKHGPPPVPKE